MFSAKIGMFLAVILLLTYAVVAIAPEAGDEASVASEYAALTP